jgi:hypothetical protein
MGAPEIPGNRYERQRIIHLVRLGFRAQNPLCLETQNILLLVDPENRISLQSAGGDRTKLRDDPYAFYLSLRMVKADNRFDFPLARIPSFQ